MNREPRYWDDTLEGEQLPGFELTLDKRRLVLAVSGTQDFYELHYDEAFARTSGLAATVVSNAFLRAALGRLIGNWLGDHGFLERMRVEMRAPVLAGQRIAVAGRVARRYATEERLLVDIEAAIVTDDRIRAAIATATARLPARPIAARSIGHREETV